MMVETIQLIAFKKMLILKSKFASKALGPETYFINIQMESIISDELLYC